MKKLFAVLLMLVLTTAPALAYDGDILFRSIPWGTDEITAESELAKEGMQFGLDLENYGILVAGVVNNSPKVVTYSYDRDAIGQIGTHKERMGFPGDGWDGKVAGYDVLDVDMYYAYGDVNRARENTKLYAATYKFGYYDVSDEDFESMYSDLLNKLRSVYGITEKTYDNCKWLFGEKWIGLNDNSLSGAQSDERYSVWLGKNDKTLVCLSSLHNVSLGIKSMKITYADLSGDKILADILLKMQTQIAGDTSGL